MGSSDRGPKNSRDEGGEWVWVDLDSCCRCESLNKQKLPQMVLLVIPTDIGLDLKEGKQILKA